MTNALSLNWKERADRCIADWHLSDVVWSDLSQYSSLGFCKSPHGRAVLKVGRIDNMIPQEVAALRTFGDPCPAVYEASLGEHAYLMEDVGDGARLSDIYPSTDEEVEIWLSIYRCVHSGSQETGEHPTLRHYARIFRAVASDKLSPRLARLMRFGDELQGILMDGELRLLHGDMHHLNILRDRGSRWRLIDPHGVIGNPLYEVGAFIRNPMPTFYREKNVALRLEQRLNLLASALERSEKELAEFAFYGVAFSLAWDLEEGSETVDEDLVTLGELCLTLAGHCPG